MMLVSPLGCRSTADGAASSIKDSTQKSSPLPFGLAKAIV
jgi:hypothetical protein